MNRFAACQAERAEEAAVEAATEADDAATASAEDLAATEAGATHLRSGEPGLALFMQDDSSS